MHSIVVPDAEITAESRFSDCVMRQRLEKIFDDRDLRTSRQVCEFLRSLQDTTSQALTIKHYLLEFETKLSEHYSVEELLKLSVLWIAVMGSCYDSVELLVRSGADVNEPFGIYGFVGKYHGNLLYMSKDSNILHALLQMKPTADNERVVRLILNRHDIDLQARDSWKQTALHFAAEHGRVELVKMLLEKGAFVNVSNFEEVTPLLKAARHAKGDELIPLFIENGADVTLRDEYGRNALHYLSHRPDEKKNSVKLAKIFIEMGVSLEDREYSGRNFQPIHEASEAGHDGLVSF